MSSDTSSMPDKAQAPLRFGMLGAARVGPDAQFTSDRAMHATYTLVPDSVIAETFADLSAPGLGPLGLIPCWPQIAVAVALEGGDVEVFNPLDPGVYHHIAVKPKGGPSPTEKHYRYTNGRGEKTWHSYTFQLHGFVDKVRGKAPWAWTEPTTTITAIETMERICAKAGLPPHGGASTYKPEKSQGA